MVMMSSHQPGSHVIAVTTSPLEHYLIGRLLARNFLNAHTRRKRSNLDGPADPSTHAVVDLTASSTCMHTTVAFSGYLLHRQR